MGTEGLHSAPAASAEHLPEHSARDADDMFPLKDFVFGGVPVKIPNRSERVLTYLYGDYMSYPGCLAPKPEHEYRTASSDVVQALSLMDFLAE